MKGQQLPLAVALRETSSFASFHAGLLCWCTSIYALDQRTNRLA